MGITDRFRTAWNAFRNDEETAENFTPMSYGTTTSFRPDRPQLMITNERSIVGAVYTRLSVDVSLVEFRHCRLDDDRRYVEEIDSGLNNCLTVEANLDQAATALLLDVASTIFDKGVAAIVPVDTTKDPNISGGYDIKTLRVGEIIQWYPHHIRVRLYNENRGVRQEITLRKDLCAIVENPFYSVMNEPNSTLQRLIRKLSLLDSVDEQSSSGKLDMIIQLPYVIKSEARRTQAEQRRKDIEFQLKGSQYGIAYTDGTEKITQLNRPAENNLLKQVEYLVNMLYGQLGITPEIMNGTADEKVMLNYHNRTVKPVLNAIVESMRRSFLTKTARSQKQSILYFRDPFQLVPVGDLAEIADKFTRNEVLTSNEIRQFMGIKPAKDPKADELRNSNMPQSELGAPPPGSYEPEEEPPVDDDEEVFNSALRDVKASLDGIFQDLGEEP